MDAKEKELITIRYQRIFEEKFDEDDIYNFLILLRRFMNQDTPALEIAHFIAHRKRERGRFFKFLQKHRDISDRDGVLRKGLENPPIFTVDEIGTSFNGTLASLGFRPLDSSIFDDIVLCVMSLLQNVTFKSKRNGQLGRLFFAFNKEFVFTIAALKLSSGDEQILPVLKGRNMYVEWNVDNEPQTKAVLATPNYMMRVIRNKDKLKIVSK